MRKVFKGGPTELHCGGFGPDDYLIKPEHGGRWHLVQFGFGRHFRRDGPDPREEKCWMSEIMKRMRHVSIPDIRDVINRRGGLDAFPTVNGAEFAARYTHLMTEEAR